MKIFYQSESPISGKDGLWEPATRVPVEYIGKLWDYEPFVHVAYAEGDKKEVYIEWNIEGVLRFKVEP